MQSLKIKFSRSQDANGDKLIRVQIAACSGNPVQSSTVSYKINASEDLEFICNRPDLLHSFSFRLRGQYRASTATELYPSRTGL